MASSAGVERSDYDALLAKLQSFAETLSPGEQRALANVLQNGGAPAGADDDFPKEAWKAFNSFVGNNGGG